MYKFLQPEPPASRRWMSGWCHGSTRSERQASKHFTPFFLEAGGVTYSCVFFVDILTGCEVHEYRCRIVDAIVNKGITTRGCSGGNGSNDTRGGVGSGV